jgi:hypothetical protein
MLSKNSLSINANLYDGRLVFETLSDFHDSMNILKRVDEKNRKQLFEEYYENDFVPLYPYYEADIDDNLIETYFDLKQQYTPSNYTLEYFSFEDPLIASDNFASFLNIKREIVIDNEIYAYTFFGLIKTETRNIIDLYDFINSNNAYTTEIDPTENNPGFSTPSSHPTLEIWTNPVHTNGSNNCGGVEEGNIDMTMSPGYNSSVPSFGDPMDDFYCTNFPP